MTTPILSVREIQAADIEPLADYWIHSDPAFMESMGVDRTKIPEREALRSMLGEQLKQDYPAKKAYCIIWLLDGKPIGHSNVNKIIYGEEAYMHLHIWDAAIRKRGYGKAFIQLTLPYFFRNLELKKLFCEPYALNPAPNKTLEKLGFRFIKEYNTIPGWLNFEQPVKLWEMNRDAFQAKK